MQAHGQIMEGTSAAFAQGFSLSDQLPRPNCLQPLPVGHNLPYVRSLFDLRMQSLQHGSPLRTIAMSSQQHSDISCAAHTDLILTMRNVCI